MTSISIKGTHSNSGSPPGLKLTSPRVPASWHVVVVVDPQEMLVTARYPRDQSTPPIPTAKKDHTGAPSITRQKKAAADFHGTKSRGGPARRLCEMVMASNGGFTGLATISETHCPSRPAVGIGAARSRQPSTRRTEASFPVCESALRVSLTTWNCDIRDPFPAPLSARSETCSPVTSGALFS